ncbi:response regulator transcription factor [Candidatus Saccharibacteria bacterium]|jgi:DNA-binding response OmpR family regulator|nr:response regulator transcription factor [Candidatus Saccharibacteria bacterium]
MIKIAVIEDDPIISQMYRMKFEAEGFEVAIADNGELGVEMVETEKPDIVLLDLLMPQMNGDEALAKIRQQKHGQKVPVLILTNFDEQESPDSLKKLDVAGYIIKADFTPTQVVAKVRQIVKKPAGAEPLK